MRIVTWNILAQCLIDSKDFPGLSPFELEFPQRIKAIAKELLRLQADIYFLQEVTESAAKTLRKLIPNLAWGRLALHDQSSWGPAKGAPYGNLTAVAPSYLLISQKAEYWHPSGTAYDTSVIRRVSDSSVLTTINLHLDSASDKLRKAETRELLANMPTGEVLIAGDFNSDAPELHGLFNQHPIGKYLITDLQEQIMADYIYFNIKGVAATYSTPSPTDSLYAGSDHLPLLMEGNARTSREIPESSDQLVDEEKKLPLSEIVIQRGNLFFHGRSKTNCKPPVFRDGPFWVFREKSLAYMYGAKQTSYGFLDERRKKQFEDTCWNLLTFKSSRTLRLLDLSQLQTRLAVRNYFKTVKWPDLPYTYEDLPDLPCMPEETDVVNGTCEPLVDCLFPDDQPLLNKAMRKFPAPVGSIYQRNSLTEIDNYFARILFNVLPQYDGWYIGPMKAVDTDLHLPGAVFPEEYMIWNPAEKLVLDKHETYDYQRITDILQRCPGDFLDCYNRVAKAFQQNQLACLIDKQTGRIHCYLIEELVNQNVVTEQQLKVIKDSLAKGESYIELV